MHHYSRDRFVLAAHSFVAASQQPTVVLVFISILPGTDKILALHKSSCWSKGQLSPNKLFLEKIVYVFCLFCMRFSAWMEKASTSNNFVKYDIKCILVYSFIIFHQLYVFNHFRRSQSFLVSTHELFSMNNQKMMQEPS